MFQAAGKDLGLRRREKKIVDNLKINYDQTSKF